MAWVFDTGLPVRLETSLGLVVSTGAEFNTVIGIVSTTAEVTG